jgi:hypothetical protein
MPNNFCPHQSLLGQEIAVPIDEFEDMTMAYSGIEMLWGQGLPAP